MATLLVVEDDPIVLAYYETVLVDAGYPTVAVLNAEDALEALRERQDISGVITDIRLPGMTGISLVEQARALKPHLLIILISAEVQLEEGDVPADCVFLSKPVRVADVLSALRDRMAQP